MLKVMAPAPYRYLSLLLLKTRRHSPQEYQADDSMCDEFVFVCIHYSTVLRQRPNRIHRSRGGSNVTFSSLLKSPGYVTMATQFMAAPPKYLAIK